jgi:CheY-like chemotaxis protein
VDDERVLNELIATILEADGFDVVTASTVSEALPLIQSQAFDVLVSDLNIGELSDGFTLASVMRRTQPGCRNLILTGYPDFDAALEKLRQQVDGFLVKPIKRKVLLKAVHDRLSTPPAKVPAARLRLAAIVRRHQSELLRQWLRKTPSPQPLSPPRAPNGEQLGELPLVIEQIAKVLEADQWPAELPEGLLSSALRHGRLRRRQHYPLEMIVQELRVLQREFYALMFEKLLEIEMRHVLRDLAALTDMFGAWTEKAIIAFLTPEES